MTAVGERADAEAALSARREDIVRGSADLPLFSMVFTGQREDTVATAGRMLDALIEVTRARRADDFSAPSIPTWAGC